MAGIECFPVWDFIKDEIEARGWDKDRLADRMGGDWGVNLCILDMMENCGESHPQMYMSDEIAYQLGAAFGTSAEMWLNLDRSYRKCREQRDALQSN